MKFVRNPQLELNQRERIVEKCKSQNPTRSYHSVTSTTLPVSAGGEQLVWLSSDDFAAGEAAHEMLALPSLAVCLGQWRAEDSPLHISSVVSEK